MALTSLRKIYATKSRFGGTKASIANRYAAKVGPSVVPCAATLLLDGAVDAHPGLGFGFACPYDPLYHASTSQKTPTNPWLEFSTNSAKQKTLGIPRQVHQGIFEENQIHGLQHALWSCRILCQQKSFFQLSKLVPFCEIWTKSLSNIPSPTFAGFFWLNLCKHSVSFIHVGILRPVCTLCRAWLRIHRLFGKRRPRTFGNYI